MGHLKLVAEISTEEFLFLSLTRLERVDVTAFASWTEQGDDIIGLDLEINVLGFGHSKNDITAVVDKELRELFI